LDPTAVNIKIEVLWDVCNLVESYERLRGKFCILLQVRRVSRVGNGQCISKEMTKENRVANDAQETVAS
jgi:hypothetical protein